MWLVDESLKEFPYVLDASFAIERGISTLRILRRYCEGNGWDAAAERRSVHSDNSGIGRMSC